MPGTIRSTFEDNHFLDLYECQYHRDITISRDIEKVYFVPYTKEELDICNESIKILEKLNIPYEKLGYDFM